jgi:4-amino-4-deoxy-L-arabinose transferase-like glycosyltransferase
MKKITKFFRFVNKNKFSIILTVIFLFEIFFRFYQLDTRNPFGYDQVDNAWAAKNIVLNHEFTAVGMPAKANSGIYIGPVYYYFLAVIYWITNLNPIASGIAAGLTSIFNFGVIFYVSKKLFSKNVALIAVFINTFVLHEIFFDRVQVPINFIPSIALLIFYVLYKITQGDVKKILTLAVLVGFSFHVHFTAVFFPIMILMTLPFFPWNKQTLKYILFSIPLFLVWILPSTMGEISRKSDYNGFSTYLQTNFHGFHLRRVLQLTGDGLIQFEQYVFTDALKPLKYILIPLFFLVYLFKSVSKKKIVFCYLVLLWFVVPWLSFATYKGEITDYYFAISRYLALLIVSYFLIKVWTVKNIVPKAIILIVLIYFAFTNLINFIPYRDGGVHKLQTEVSASIKRGEKIPYQHNVPESYMYFYLMRQRGINVY